MTNRTASTLTIIAGLVLVVVVVGLAFGVIYP